MATKTTKRSKSTGKRTTRRATGRKPTAGRSTPIGATITKREFARAAQRLQLSLDTGEPGAAKVELEPREFSSGSFGWFTSEKLEVRVGAKKVRCQMSLNVTVIGSKKSK